MVFDGTELGELIPHIGEVELVDLPEREMRLKDALATQEGYRMGEDRAPLLALSPGAPWIGAAGVA